MIQIERRTAASKELTIRLLMRLAAEDLPTADNLEGDLARLDREEQLRVRQLLTKYLSPAQARLAAVALRRRSGVSDKRGQEWRRCSTP
jgi:hypothetical protein